MPSRAHPPATTSPAPAGAATHTFPQEHRSVGLARAALRGQLAIWQVDDSDVTDNAVLVLSELVTNAVRAEAAGCWTVEVRFALTGRTLRLEVSDGSDAQPVPKGAAHDDECGRGLALVDALAGRWGTEPLPPVGKIVWAQLVLPGGSRAPTSAADQLPRPQAGRDSMTEKNTHPKTTSEGLREAEQVHGELSAVLRGAGIVLPSLGVDALAYGDETPTPLVELGRCNLQTARKLIAVVSAGRHRPSGAAP